MGVALGDLISSEEIGFEELGDKVIALDAYNIIYQFLASIRQRDGKPLVDSQGRVTSHLSGLLYRTSNLLEASIKPVYVFDGKPDIMKEGTLEKRKERKVKAKEEYEKALEEGDLERARTKAQQTSRMSKEIVESSDRLLELMGIPVVYAPAEGEGQAAYIAKVGDAWACGSQDFDSLLCGCPKLVRNLTVTGKRKLPGRNEYKEVSPELIVLEEVLDELGITREQLVDIAILCGTDYNQGVKGIGPKRGLKYIKKHGDLESVLEERDEEVNNYEVIRKLFLEPKVTDDYELNFESPQVDELKEFLIKEHDFTEDRIRSVLDKLSAVADSKKQSTLFSFG